MAVTRGFFFRLLMCFSFFVFERSGTWRFPQGSAKCGIAEAWLYKILCISGTEWNLAVSAWWNVE